MTPTTDGSTGVPPFAPPPARGEEGRQLRALGRGEALYRMGDLSDTVYRIEEGLLKLGIETPGGKERILALAGPGDLLGSVGFGPAGLQENAEALSAQAVVSVIPRERLLPYAADELLAAAAQQVERLRDALTDSDLPVAARVARTLLRLGQRFGHRGDDGTVWLTMPLTHDHLGSMVGAARETTSSALGEIRSAGVLKGTRGRYRFDPEALERFASEASAN